MSRPVEVALRVAIAVFGGYGTAYAIAWALAGALPLNRVDAAAYSVYPALLVYLGVMLWVFSTRSMAGPIALATVLGAGFTVCTLVPGT